MSSAACDASWAGRGPKSERPHPVSLPKLQAHAALLPGGAQGPATAERPSASHTRSAGQPPTLDPAGLTRRGSGPRPHQRQVPASLSRSRPEARPQTVSRTLESKPVTRFGKTPHQCQRLTHPGVALGTVFHPQNTQVKSQSGKTTLCFGAKKIQHPTLQSSVPCWGSLGAATAAGAGERDRCAQRQRQREGETERARGGGRQGGREAGGRPGGNGGQSVGTALQP